MKVTATIQARLGSKRLPSKVLKKICDKPLLEWQIDRLRMSKKIDDIIISTTDNSIDDEIASFCTKKNIKYFRGSEQDVLDRVANTIKKFSVEIHVECFGDSPLPDFQVIDEMINFFQKNNNYDFVSNGINSTYPSGLEVHIYKGSDLLLLNNMISSNDPLREHVGYNMLMRPEQFNQYSFEAPKELNFPDLSLEVDEEADFIFLEKLVDYFYNKKLTNFNTIDIIDYVKKIKKL